MTFPPHLSLNNRLEPEALWSGVRLLHPEDVAPDSKTATLSLRLRLGEMRAAPTPASPAASSRQPLALSAGGPLPCVSVPLPTVSSLP